MMFMNYDLETEEGMANAVAWTAQTLALINDGGVWLVPRSGMRVMVHHADKAVTIYAGHTPDPSIPRVIEAMGWAVNAHN